MSRTLRSAMNESNPNKAADGLHTVLAGDMAALIPLFVSGLVTANAMVLPSDRKAQAVLSAFARVGGATGPLTPVSGAPAAGQVGVSPTGDILFAAASAVTDAEVTYAAQDGNVVTETVDIAASTSLFLQNKRGVRVLAVTVLTSNIPAGLGAKTVDARGTAPAATKAALTTPGTGVGFNAADVVTGTASVAYVATPGVGSAEPGLAGRLGSLVSF